MSNNKKITYELKTDANERHTLFINGQPSACPHRTSQMVQDNLGRTLFVSQPCDSTCPLFEKTFAGLTQFVLVVTHCSGRKIDIDERPSEILN